MKKLLLLLIMVLAISCGSRDDEPIVTPSDGYVLATSSLDSNIAFTKWVTHNGQNPSSSVYFNGTTKTINLILKGVEYINSPIYYKKDTNMAGEFYIKTSSGYGKIYMEKSPYAPLDVNTKQFTFTGFTPDVIVYSMIKQ